MKKIFVEELVFEEYDFTNLKINNSNKNNLNFLENLNNTEELNYRYSNDNLYFKSEISLWKAVILQALVDLQSKSKKKIANTYRIKSLMWFNLKNENFVTVCNYAGLEPKYVYEKAQIVKNKNKFFI